MKRSIHLLGILTLTASGAVYGQATATATASITATVVTPLAITKTTDMNFGNVSVSTSLGTVVLTPAGTRSATGGVGLSTTSAGTVTAASFGIAGMGNYAFAITLPSTAVTLSSTTNSMTADTFTSTPSGTGVLSGGSATLAVGATLHLSATQAASVTPYVTTTPISVGVNYN